MKQSVCQQIPCGIMLLEDYKEGGVDVGALDGIRVLDLSRLLPGPYCSMLLADFGAEVIKIEEPGRGDYSRSFPPFQNGFGYWHLQLNRNKKSAVLDLKSDAGRAACDTWYSDGGYECGSDGGHEYPDGCAPC